VEPVPLEGAPLADEQRGNWLRKQSKQLELGLSPKETAPAVMVVPLWWRQEKLDLFYGQETFLHHPR
jgi:hypothetical protein